MNELEIIRRLCAEKGITIAKLEKDLGFGNGYLSKAKSLKVDRLRMIADYFGKPFEIFATDSEYLFYPNGLTREPLLVEQVKKGNARVREDILLHEYLEDLPMRRLILYAGSNLPLEDRDKYVDALIQTINTLNSFRK